MIATKTRAFLVRTLSIALVSASFAPYSIAGVIGTDYLVETETRAASLERVEAFMARAEVASRLQQLGVDAADIEARLAGLTTAELQALENRIDDQVAGGDAIAVIGTVFLVLLILELVGVTDVFKKI